MFTNLHIHIDENEIGVCYPMLFNTGFIFALIDGQARLYITLQKYAKLHFQFQYPKHMIDVENLLSTQIIEFRDDFEFQFRSDQFNTTLFCLK